MPIDVDRVVGSTLGESSFTWTEDDMILYNLAVGAGAPPDSPGELKYVYQNNLTAVPSFGAVPPFGLMMAVGAADGIDISLAQILHGDHQLQIHGPIPVSGTVHQTGSVKAVYDKGKGALLVVEVVSTLAGSNEPLFTNTAGIFIRGEGGFGGDRGPAARRGDPERLPDVVVESPTLPQQALLYRIASGDMNPLHADPGFAAVVGYERPILHGLCTYGVICKAVIDAALDGDPGSVGDYGARFSGHVFPGETLVTKLWDQDDGTVFSTTTRERGLPVISGGSIKPR